MKEFAHVGLEHALVVVDQAHAGKGHPHPQNQNLQPPHKELEVEDEIHNDEHQPKDGSHKAERGNTGHPARPIVGGGKADGLQHLVAHFLHNSRKPAVHGGETDRHGHRLEKVRQQGNRFFIRVAIGPQHIGFKALFEKFQDDKGHAKAKHNIKQGFKQIDTERIRKELDDNKIVIVTGFQGINKYDDITTLGRGGSDTTAVALAAELHADVCEIYTDVDGVYTADPRIVPNARKMEEVTYDEMLEMASLGAKVLHSRCVEIAKKYGVELLVCSSLNRNSGTMVREKTKMEKMLISGVAADKNVAKIRVAGLGNDPESTFRLLNLLDRNNLNIDVMIQSLGKDGTKSVSFTVAKPDMLRTIDVLNDNKDSLGIKKLDYDENVAKISVIGAGVRSHSGVAAKMFGALANAGINTEMITTSEIRITALIDEAYADQAMRAIHETFLERV